MRLQFRTGAAALLLLLTATTLVAGDLPWVGKWKFNPAKSDLGQTSITFAQTGPGEMQLTADGQSYTFKMDGKDYPAIFGYTAAWKQIDAGTWEITSKLKGTVTGVDTVKFSSDGKTLSIESRGKKPNGDAFDNTTVYQRASGGPGLAGKWMTQNLKTTAPSVMEYVANGPNGITFTIPDENITCKSMFDGKDYPFTGPRIPPGFTVVLKRTGQRSFEMTTKKDGKAVYVDTITVSEDGKVLTDTGSAAGVDEKYKYVSDRQ